MRKIIFNGGLIVAGLMSANVAHAQSQTGAELIGQTVDVAFADGTRNSIVFGSGGQARINGTNGASSAATWGVEGPSLCLTAGGAKECFAYANRFAAGQTATLASSCGAPSQWTARSVNAPPAPPPVAPPPPPVAEVRAGERG